jgi:hypothetical protein
VCKGAVCKSAKISVLNTLTNKTNRHIILKLMSHFAAKKLKIKKQGGFLKWKSLRQSSLPL